VSSRPVWSTPDRYRKAPVPKFQTSSIPCNANQKPSFLEVNGALKPAPEELQLSTQAKLIAGSTGEPAPGKDRCEVYWLHATARRNERRVLRLR
jgi:hypothetical protein